MAWSSRFTDSRPFYRSEFWADLSDRCKRRDGHRCTKCGWSKKLDGNARQLHAHHVISRIPLPKPTALDVLSNLVTLCDECHDIQHGHSRKPASPGRGKPLIPPLFKAKHRRR